MSEPTSEVTTDESITLSEGEVFSVEWMGDESLASTTVRILAIQTAPIIVITGKQQ